jgi:hypothetical protein
MVFESAGILEADGPDHFTRRCQENVYPGHTLRLPSDGFGES